MTTPLCASALASSVPFVRWSPGSCRIREFDPAHDIAALQRLADIHAGFGRFDAKRVRASGVIVAEGPDGLAGALHSVRNGAGTVSRVDLLVINNLHVEKGLAQLLFDAYLAECEGAGVLTCVAPIPEAAAWRDAAEALLVHNRFSVTGHDPEGLTWEYPLPASPWRPFAYGASRIFSRALSRSV